MSTPPMEQWKLNMPKRNPFVARNKQSISWLIVKQDSLNIFQNDRIDLLFWIFLEYGLLSLRFISSRMQLYSPPMDP